MTPMLRLCLLVVAVLASACSHRAAPPGASPLSARERRVVVAHGVDVTAPRWADTLVELTTALVPGPDRAATRERLRARHRDAGPSFTVVIELADRPLDDDVLLEQGAWWFRCGGEKATTVDLVAIDRFPTGDGRAHARLAFDVGFAKSVAPAARLELGSTAAVSRRPELGRTIARRGVALRW
jgi:hypothetical protein